MPDEHLHLKDGVLEKDLSLDGDPRVDNSVEGLERSIADSLFYMQGKHPRMATDHDIFMAVSYSVRDRLINRVLKQLDALAKTDWKILAYFSAEYLPGPFLGENLFNLDIYDNAQKALKTFGIDLEAILEKEVEPGLGNGGLGRLAACYLDSLATLEIPAVGYGLRYEFGIFNQEIRNGWQIEQSDKWLQYGNPWEIARPESFEEVKLGGRTEPFRDSAGNYRVRWIPSRTVKGIPYDIPILGYGCQFCNFLRLWKAEASESFDLAAFNIGDYYRAVEQKMISENITKVLYPNDEVIQGKRLRLEQQYFFVSCSLQNMIRILLNRKQPLESFAERFAAQLNDTHPALAIAELMRLLVDVHLMDWDTAWDITQRTFGYTNHTLLPEALEKWPLPLFAELLPRPLEIIYEINRRFLDEVRKRYPEDNGRLSRMSIIEESNGKFVRMANLACIGSHSVNGVARLHTKLLETKLFKDFVDFWPQKFNNKTNGISPRRFLALSNPHLRILIDSKIGCRWVSHLDDLHRLEEFADDEEFQHHWRVVKSKNKHKLAKAIQESTGVLLNPDTLYDIQVKRIHEYKRQHLNLLHIITLYNRIRRNPSYDVLPRTFIFGGKAAPGYRMAKLIIKLINSVAEVINRDPIITDRIKVVFYPNFNVKNAQKIYPAADLSEQISLAGTEASGTGNMKFALNGALTIGTQDGANIEICDEIGDENFFYFGLTAYQVAELKAKGYSPRSYYDSNSELRQAIDLIASGYFSGGDRDLFKPVVDQLLNSDPFLLLADYDSYIRMHEQITKLYRDPKLWTRKSILTTARMGKFSSDRAITEYTRDIWNCQPSKVLLQNSHAHALL